MLNTLLPHYFAPQQPSVNSNGESTLSASSSNFLLMDQPLVSLETKRMEVYQSERGNSQAPLDSAISKCGTYHWGTSFDCSSDYLICTTQGGMSREEIATDQ